VGYVHRKKCLLFILFFSLSYIPSAKEPKMIIVTRSEQDVESLEQKFRADTSPTSIFTRLIFCYEKSDKFGNRQKAIALFTDQRRNVFICAENCLSGK